MGQGTKVGQLSSGTPGKLVVALLALVVVVVLGAGLIGATPADATTPTPPPPHWVLSAVSGDWQKANQGQVFPEPVVVSVTSTYSALAGVPVTFSVDSGVTFVDGSTSVTVTTGADGRATSPKLRADDDAPFRQYGVTARSSYGSAFFPTGRRRLRGDTDPTDHD